MKLISANLSGLRPVLMVMILGVAGQVARANITYFTPPGSTTGGGAVNAKAVFTLNNGSISLTLTNLLQNPTADSQLISGFLFNVSGASGSGSLTTTNSGLVSSISAGGTYSAGVSDLLTRWKATETGTAIKLTTLSGGAPNRLIIGPDSTGGFSHAGLFSHANPSITNAVHNPSVLGSATFNIVIPGVTTTSVLSNVVFQFGTTAGSNQVHGQTTVPAPAGVALGIFGLSLVGWMKRRLA